jgi:Zn-dependent protease
MSEFYAIDSTRISLGEYWSWHRSPLVFFSLLNKWLKAKVPISSDDPNVDSILVGAVESFPPGVEEKFAPLAAELAALGFADPVTQTMEDPGTRTTWYWRTYRHVSGRYFARIHHRVWRQAAQPNRALFAMIVTEFADGTFLVSTAGKPDMAQPRGVRVNRVFRAGPSALFDSHEKMLCSALGTKEVLPAAGREGAMRSAERLHILQRDYNLARGVFRPRGAAEQERTAAYAETVARLQAAGEEDAGALAELERLQSAKPGWGSGGAILAVSLLAFLAAGAWRSNWAFTLWLVPILAFHELGHWAAMRVFGYRDLRMFFIPFFGAAVTGKHWNTPGWKRSLVALAGPVPGIVLGLGVGAVAIATGSYWLNRAAFYLLFLNGFNLLPILPFDGGHVLQATLFCRNRWLDIGFRILAIAGAGLLGWFGIAPGMRYVAIVFAISLPTQFKMGKAIDTLRREPLPPPTTEQDRIPLPAARRIIAVVKTLFAKKLPDRTLAQYALNLFETLNAKPPGVAATLGLWAAHGGAFVLAGIGALLLLGARGGGLSGLLSRWENVPRHPISARAIEKWSGPQSASAQGRGRTFMVATFPSAQTARQSYNDLKKGAPPVSDVELFGDTIFVGVPSADAAASNVWRSALLSKTTNTLALAANEGVMMQLRLTMADRAAASNLVEEVRGAFAGVGELSLVPPWSPDAGRPEYSAWREARRDWLDLRAKLFGEWNDPAMASFYEKIGAAESRGATNEASRITAEMERARRNFRARIRKGFARDEARGRFFDMEAEYLYPREIPEGDKSALARKIGDALGAANPEAGSYGGKQGYASVTAGRIVDLTLVFDDAIKGPAAAVAWLGDRKARFIHYKINNQPPASTDDDEK